MDNHYLETGMMMVSNLGATCSLVFNDLAAASASPLVEKGPAITWYPFFLPGVLRMKPSLPCFLSFSSIFSALRKLGKVPTERPYFLSSSRGAKGCSLAGGGMAAVFGGMASGVATPFPGWAGGGPGVGAIGAARGGGTPGASETPAKACGFSANLAVGAGAVLMPIK